MARLANATLESLADRVSSQDAALVLICGPTGSGKSTALAALSRCGYASAQAARPWPEGTRGPVGEGRAARGGPH